MHVVKAIAFLFTLITSTVQVQDAQWNGDPSVCQLNSTSPSSNKKFPDFPEQAQFIMETISSTRIDNNTANPTIAVVHYYYDYNANMMALKRNSLGFVELEYYYYNILKKTTYYPQRYCVVTDIPTNITGGK